VDLKDLCDQIIDVDQVVDIDFNDAVRAAATNVVSRLVTVVIQSGCSGFAYQWSHGLSLYFPWALVSPDYENMEFAKSTVTGTGWDDFIKDLVDDTRRGDRRQPPPPIPTLTIQEKNALAKKCGKASADWAKRDPSLKPGGINGIKAAVEARAHRSIQRFEKDGVAADEIVQELGSEFIKIGRYNRRKRYTTGERYNRRKRYTLDSSSPADREMAIKNFAPVIAVYWWPNPPPSLSALASGSPSASAGATNQLPPPPPPGP
jgi:hypothetical protein